MVNKQIKILAAEIAIILIVIAIASYFTLTGFAIENQTNENLIAEKSVEIEVWASSQIEINLQNSQINSNVLIDNGTELDNENFEMYLNDKIISKNKSLFNLSGTSPGNYTLRVIFQGSSSQYISESLIEKEMNIDENGKIKFIQKETSPIQDSQESQETQIEETNITKENNETQSLKTKTPENCETFSEDILWSSGYSNKENSMNYEPWGLNQTCQDCFISNIELKTRFLSSANENQQKEGYVQISNSNQKTFCESPGQGTYEKYLAYETLRGESKRLGLYKQGNQTLDLNSEGCYGIRLYADQNFIVDAFEIKYDLCENEN